MCWRRRGAFVRAVERFYRMGKRYQRTCAGSVGKKWDQGVLWTMRSVYHQSERGRRMSYRERRCRCENIRTSVRFDFVDLSKAVLEKNTMIKTERAVVLMEYYKVGDILGSGYL